MFTLIKKLKLNSVLIPAFLVIIIITIFVALLINFERQDAYFETMGITSNTVELQERLSSNISAVKDNLKFVKHNLGSNSLTTYDKLVKKPNLFFYLSTILFSSNTATKVGFITNNSKSGYYINNLTSSKIPLTEADLLQNTNIAVAITELKYQRTANQTRPYLNADSSDYFVTFFEPILFNNQLVAYIYTEKNLSTLVKKSIPDKMNNFLVTVATEDDKPIVGSAIAELFDYYSNQSLLNRALLPRPLVITEANLKLQVAIFPKEHRYITSISWLLITLFFFGILTLIFLVINLRQNYINNNIQKNLIKESNFRVAIETCVPIGIRALDMQGITTYVNQTFCDMFAKTKAEIIGHTPSPYFWNDDIKQQIIDKQQNHEVAIFDHTTSVKNKQGHQFTAHIFITPLTDDNHQQIGWINSVLDISEEEKIRQQLINSYLQFTTILQSIDAAVSVAMVGKKELVFSNKQYKQWFGAAAKYHFALLSAGITKADSSPSTGVDKKTETYFASVDRWLDIRTRYLTWTDGNLAQMVIALDVTERHLLNKKYAQQAEELATQNHLISLGEITSTVAHELNQPLSAINNYCNGLISRLNNQTIENADLINVLTKTANQAKRAADIIQRIRDFIKRRETKCSMSNINSIVNDALDTTYLTLNNAGIKFKKNIAQNLPDIYVDPLLVGQVLVNLIKNSIEAILNANRPFERRLIILTIEQKKLAKTDGVEFSISDTGIGIPDQIIPTIFDAFFSTKENGMGIGLKLCRSIIETLHGRIVAKNLYQNEQKVGSCFTFWLPINHSNFLNT